MIKLDDTSIFTGHIKQLLATFNLPNCDIGPQYPINGKLFIDDGLIYRWKAVDNKNNFDREIVDRYIIGSKYMNLTTNFKIENLIYDRATHRYLGKYLRFLRDYQNLDLMCMYNCFDGDILTSTNPGCVIKSSTGSTIFSVPISGLSDLTILLNSYFRCDICLYIDNESISTTDLKLLTNTTLKTGKYNKSFIYSIYGLIAASTYLSELVDKYRDDLRLLIKIPDTASKNIVVLEGIYDSYVNNDQKLHTYHPEELLEKKFLTTSDPSTDSYVKGDKFLTDNTRKFLYISGSETVTSPDFIQTGYVINVQLLSPKSSYDQWLLSDRLVEYLCGNVITNISSDYDIKHLQKCIDKELRKTLPGSGGFVTEIIDRTKASYVDYRNTQRYYGKWNPRDLLNLRVLAYNNKLNISKYDVLGYLDKDMESLIQGSLDSIIETEIEGDFN